MTVQLEGDLRSVRHDNMEEGAEAIDQLGLSVNRRNKRNADRDSLVFEVHRGVDDFMNHLEERESS